VDRDVGPKKNKANHTVLVVNDDPVLQTTNNAQSLEEAFHKDFGGQAFAIHSLLACCVRTEVAQAQFRKHVTNAVSRHR
jgi:hypothetical protein